MTKENKIDILAADTGFSQAILESTHSLKFRLLSKRGAKIWLPQFIQLDLTHQDI